MILIHESKTRKNSFEKYLVDNESSKKSLIKIVDISSKTQPHTKRDYTIIYDSQMNPIKECFEYINYELLTSSPNTVMQSVSALRLLYSYLELLDLNIEKLTDEDVRNLRYFLRGFSPHGNFITIDLSTERSNVTINTYLSIYRKYTEFLGLKDSPLHKISDITKSCYVPESEVIVKSESYVHTEKVKKQKTVPMYISLKEYEAILNLIDKEYTLREKCIVRLMFEGGLRIGEVLGLTSEDIKIEEFHDKNNDTHFKSGVVYIRNRITDKKHQLAKRKDIIKTRRTYSTKAYKDETDKAFISTDLADMIIDYINDAHDSYSRKSDVSKELFEKNYKKYTITDIVSPEDNIDKYGFKILDENSYIFINSLGKPIGRTSWNSTLREILSKCGIKVDKSKRTTNLNHRFRHGFAMFLVKYRHISIGDLMKLMRHNSITSTQVYYRPTEDDIALVRNGFSKTLEELIPTVAYRKEFTIGEYSS